MIKLYIRIILLLSLFLSSCVKEYDPCDGYEPKEYHYFLTSNEKSKIPFKSGYDSMIFISNTGDTAILSGTGVNPYIGIASEYVTSDPACGLQHYWYLEIIKYSFGSANPLLKTLVYQAYVNKANEEHCLIQINQISFDIYLGYINYDPRYLDSVVVNGTAYKGVTIIESKNGVTGKNSFLYNYHYGFLKISLEDKTWIRSF